MKLFRAIRAGLALSPTVLFCCGLLPAALAQDMSGPMQIVDQGSFFVGGRKVQGKGEYAPAKVSEPSKEGYTNEGSTFWIDQMYVQYEIPVNARRYPIVMIPGGSSTGDVWESTPDGREGYQTLFLRRGFSVYIVDPPHRGRSGYPSFNGTFGNLDGAQIVPDNTRRAGLQYAWVRWRIGPQYPDVFPVQQFPMAGLEQFMERLVPTVSDDANVTSGAVVKLLEKIGPAILVTHSESGLSGWLTGAHSPNVRGIIAYEPGFVFPRDRMPAPIPLSRGTIPAGTPFTDEEFSNLVKIPIEVVYGGNIPQTPTENLPADGRRAQQAAAKLFAKAINDQGGNTSIVMLPDLGLHGNSHFVFSDLNNREVADQMAGFLREKHLDIR
jgi:pimeloyl-ACP methyl ester carboxylesterase